jgi:hypothetical protein
MAKSVLAVHREGSDSPAFEVLDTAGAVTVKVDGTQILAEQQGAIADATDAATAITQINAILDALQAHGLIAT